MGKTYVHIYMHTYIYIYIYIVLFGPVKPELGVIPSGQENHSKAEHLNFPGRELNVINFIYIYMYVYIYVCVYIYVYVCVCVCVCVFIEGNEEYRDMLILACVNAQKILNP